MAKVELKVINVKIGKLDAAERVTKAVLGELSRDLLQYVVVDNTNDIDAVNRTIAVLTPMNKTTAAFFFKAMLPFNYDEDDGRFTTRIKKADKKLEEMNKFLLNEDNTIWTWAEKNLKIDKKPTDFLKNITKNVAKGLADEDANISVSDIMKAVLAAEGITAADILAALTGNQEAKDEAIANL